MTPFAEGSGDTNGWVSSDGLMMKEVARWTHSTQRRSHPSPNAPCMCAAGSSGPDGDPSTPFPPGMGAGCRSDAGPSTRANLEKTGQSAGEPPQEQQRPQGPTLALVLLVLPPPSAQGNHSEAVGASPPSSVEHSPLCAHVLGWQSQLQAVNVHLPAPRELYAAIAETSASMSSPYPAAKDHRSPKKELSPDAANPTIVLHLPGFRLAMLASVCDSFWCLASTFGTAAALLIAAYVVYTLAWNVVSLWASILVDASVSVLLGFSTFMSCIMLSMDAKPKATPVRYHYVPKPAAVVIEGDEMEEKPVVPAHVKLPSLSPEGSIVSQSTPMEKTDDAAFAKEKELQVPVTRRRMLSHLKQCHPVVNVVAGETRRRAQMSLQDASIRVGKAHTQKVPGSRKPQDIYVVRVDCGARSAAQEKHMNPVIMWDLTATFEEFQKLERELKKEVKAKKLTSEAKVPHLSSGAVLFVQEELTDHVLNARRLRLQNFIETVRSNPVLANTASMRKFCQAF